MTSLINEYSAYDLQNEVQLTDTRGVTPQFLPFLTKCLLISKCLLIVELRKMGFFAQIALIIKEFFVKKTFLSVQKVVQNKIVNF